MAEKKFKIGGCKCERDDCGNEALKSFDALIGLVREVIKERLASGEMLLDIIGETLYSVHVAGMNLEIEKRVAIAKASITPESRAQMQEMIERELGRFKTHAKH